MSNVRAELPHFSRECLALVEEMVDAGWRVTRTKKGEARLLAPDGVSSTLVSRKDNNHSLANGRAYFKRWQRRQQEGTT